MHGMKGILMVLFVVFLAPFRETTTAASATVLPAGTQITVRLIDNIDSTKTSPGQRFRASVDDPITVGDHVVIPRGADATVQIVQAKGSSELSIKLYDVTVKGKPYDVASDLSEVKAPGKGKKTARRAVGLGAIGAGIGAIAGGGSGAAIGAAAGAGLGALSGQASKSKIQLPSETRMSFILRSPLPLN
ncbi:MAG TPA: hypothetical protein VMW38_22200 [Terriglobia bacterium]|nr:hypothetical protein [Terriglobia bacterium]